MTAHDQTTRPLRAAVFGAGPSGLFLVDSLLKANIGPVSIDVFDRLCAPYGLVRYGVAPDHPKIKSVIGNFHKTLEDPRVRFFGNVEFGKDIHLADAQKHYDIVAFSVGASVDRNLNIPGEKLTGNLSATEFVAWYSGHPDLNDRDIRLDAKSVAVIGVGNVAVDVTRIIAKHVDELRVTDIPTRVLDVLADSTVEDIYLIGRRGPVQAKFTTAELRELGELANADIIVDPKHLELDPTSAETLAGRQILQRNYDVLKGFAERKPEGRPRRIHLRFLQSPKEILGDDGSVTDLVVEHNKIDERENAVGTGEFETIPVQRVYRAVGYRGVPLPGVPFDSATHVIPNVAGRILEDTGEPMPGLYVTGWIKRGPTGVIGTNKADSTDTARSIIDDVPDLPRAPEGEPEAVDALLKERNVRVCRWDDWLAIDAMERELGQKTGRERCKVTEFDAVLAGRG